MRQLLHRYEVVVRTQNQGSPLSKIPFATPGGVNFATFYVVSHGLIAAANAMLHKGELVSITQKEIIAKLALPLDSELDRR